ncbi:S1C family serine protease [Sulfuriroseicoccus oceanibius]|uniref:PDZ domain-containing protein n=1 Tax=Sulfuriroseicoccus oceanibius TaxID=2707525 RepID=A0A6B3L7X4_9BACT|nr:PDZ domain-containing protein [Sulfuriroseicoccus oceanibius]QQL46275.1 PDZ domain-containing protein [Sulfuriroseicoccus oceanibius]
MVGKSMKCWGTSIGCSLVVALASPGLAAEVTEQAPAAEVKADGQKEAVQEQRSWLGVGTRPLPQVVGKHLGLPDGAGVVVDIVIKDSPAQQAGLRRDDVITHVDGEWLKGVTALSKSLSEKKVGEVVRLSIRRRNQSLVVGATLVERPKRFAMVSGADDNRDSVFKKRVHGQDFADRMNDLMRAQMGDHEDFERMIEELDAEMEAMRKRAAAMRFEAASGGQGHMHYSMTSVDNNGRIVISRVDGKTHVKVWDREGKQVFDGPYETPEDKDKLPEDFRDRVNELNVNPTSIWSVQGFEDEPADSAKKGE